MAGIAVGARARAEQIAMSSERGRERERARKPLEEMAFGVTWGEPWRA